MQSACKTALWSIGGYDLADHDPYANKHRAKHGVEPFEGQHDNNLRFRNFFLTASSLRVPGQAEFLA